MAGNRPRSREKNVTGGSKGVKRRGSGLGTGPVGVGGGNGPMGTGGAFDGGGDDGGSVTRAFMIFTVNPAKALVFLIFLVILQQVEGNLIYPRVVGNSIGLPGLWVLAAVTIGGGVMGIGGMLIGVPMSAALYKLFAEHVNGKLETAAKD